MKSTRSAATSDQESHGFAVLLCCGFSEEGSLSPSKLDEIGMFQPQKIKGIFGALVSNDRAAEWVDRE